MGSLMRSALRGTRILLSRRQFAQTSIFKQDLREQTIVVGTQIRITDGLLYVLCYC